jgi:hypothetical protein
MKTTAVILSLSTTLFWMSCKKTTQPEPITNTVTQTNTVYDTIIIHDTVFIGNMNIIGLWKLYRIDYTGSTPSYYNNSFNKFTATQLQQDLNGDGIFENIYPCVYGSNYVDITVPNPSGPGTIVYTLNITQVGYEYRLARTVSAGVYQTWFMKL